MPKSFGSSKNITTFAPANKEERFWCVSSVG